MNDHTEAQTNPRVPERDSDFWIYLVGYLCYPVPYVYLVFRPTFYSVYHTIVRGMVDILGEFLTKLILVPSFGLFVMIPSILGPVAILSFGDRWIVARVCLVNTLLASCFLLGLWTSFSESQWIQLDLILLGHLLGNTFRLPSTVFLNWILFGFLVIAFLSTPKLRLFVLFDITAALYLFAIALLVVLGKLRLASFHSSD